MTSRLVRVEDDGPVRTLALDRPERHNALVPDLVEQLHEAVAATAEDPTVRVVILAATGPSFSTGGDVGAFAARDGTDRVTYARRLVGGLNEAILALLGLPQPSIAAVHGPVTGGSLGLVLATDLLVMGPRAWTAPYYVDVGFSPDGGWTALLPQRIGSARAAAVQLANERVDADTALAWGLATHRAEDARARAHELAGQLADKVPGSVARTVQLLRPDPAEVARGLQRELEAFCTQIASDEATAGMAAFLDAT